MSVHCYEMRLGFFETSHQCLQAPKTFETSSALRTGGEGPCSGLHTIEDLDLVLPQLSPPTGRVHRACGHVPTQSLQSPPVRNFKCPRYQKSCQMTLSFLPRLGHTLPQVDSQERITSLTQHACTPTPRLRDGEGWWFAEDVDRVWAFRLGCPGAMPEAPCAAEQSQHQGLAAQELEALGTGACIPK